MLSHGASSDSWCEPSLIGAIWSIEAFEHDFEHLSSLLEPHAGSQCFPQRFPRLYPGEVPTQRRIGLPCPPVPGTTHPH